MEYRYFSASFAVLLFCANSLFAQVKDDAITQLKLIKYNYLSEIKRLEGNSQGLYAARQNQRDQCRELVKAHSKVALTSTKLETMLALTEAAELAALPKQATEIARRVLELDITNTKAHGAILREALNAGRIDRAQKLLEDD